MFFFYDGHKEKCWQGRPHGESWREGVWQGSRLLYSKPEQSRCLKDDSCNSIQVCLLVEAFYSIYTPFVLQWGALIVVCVTSAVAKQKVDTVQVSRWIIC